MLEFCITLSMCFAFCFLCEGVETAVKKRAGKAYTVTHIVYPLFIIGTMAYILVIK